MSSALPSVPPRASSVVASCAVALLAACPPAPPPPPAPSDPGALVDVSFTSTVGVLLDELPAGPVRERVAASLLAQPSTFWEARAKRQIDAGLYRLVYRNLYFDPEEGKRQLPLPPVEQWQLSFQPAGRTTIDGHDYVAVSYSFAATLLSPVAEPGRADPALGAIGGVLEEPATLPADPEHLLERTGFACMNEDDFPPNSVDTENARWFFDDTCEAAAVGEVEDGCHVTRDVDVDCLDELAARVGTSPLSFRFERKAWDPARADAVRVGQQQPGGAQLKALDDGLADNRIVYRFFPAESCAIAEGCVGAPGWRRLLQFTATVQNLGAEAAAIGAVGPGSPPVENNMVSFSQCHEHMHFNHYGRFTFGTGAQQLGGKRAFCLESTSRYFNNEATPLTHPYNCEFQGVAPGWGDDYIAGLDCQWVDVTPVDSTGGVVAPLGFTVNPDDFLCEGELRREDDGTPLFEPAPGFTSEDGRPENRFQCDFFPDHAADNAVSVDIELPDDQGGLVTAPCAGFLVGEKRNCDFERRGAPVACAPGETVTLSCTGNDDTPAAVRVCEASQVLGGIPCLYADALATTVQTAAASTVSFACPAAREGAETGGLYATFVAPMVPDDDVGGVACAVVP
jgi:hypothetical protein